MTKAAAMAGRTTNDMKSPMIPNGGI
jgi:hypothetical protein